MLDKWPAVNRRRKSQKGDHGRHHRPGRETSSSPQAFSFFYIKEFNKEKHNRTERDSNDQRKTISSGVRYDNLL